MVYKGYAGRQIHRRGEAGLLTRVRAHGPALRDEIRFKYFFVPGLLDSLSPND
jgi:hypothetical protein